jgi:hypothetical protein
MCCRRETTRSIWRAISSIRRPAATPRPSSSSLSGSSRSDEIDVDAVGGDIERGERVALGGEALLIGLDAGIPDLQSGHGWEYAG